MNASPRRNRRIRFAGTILLALLLTLTLLPAAALASPPPADGNDPPNPGQNQNQAPLPGSNQGTPLPGVNQGPPVPGANQGTPLPGVNQGPPVPGTNQGPALPDGNQQQNSDPHPDAPEFPSADCIVTHAATPAQLCPIAGGLQYYFIGADGSSQAGPYIKPFSELATLHTSGTSVSLYTGSNPFTGKSVQIDYLPADDELRISTYYPDNEYDTDKPYTFTVDNGNSVSHIAW